MKVSQLGTGYHIHKIINKVPQLSWISGQNPADSWGIPRDGRYLGDRNPGGNLGSKRNKNPRGN